MKSIAVFAASGAAGCEVAERRVVHMDAGAPVRLGLAVEREGVGALRDGDLGHGGWAEARLVEHLRRTPVSWMISVKVARP
jgi:hypothetical protein